jgi:hypothetical protein
LEKFFSRKNTGKFVPITPENHFPEKSVQKALANIFNSTLAVRSENPDSRRRKIPARQNHICKSKKLLLMINIIRFLQNKSVLIKKSKIIFINSLPTGTRGKFRQKNNGIGNPIPL